MNIVIIGAGIAGLTAAETIRKNNPSYNVVLFSNERQSPYYRPRLPEVVSGKTSPDKLYVHPDTWFKELNLEFRKGENVVEICLDNNQVRGSLGSRLLFDRILLATGAQPFLPDVVKKFQLPGIYPLRTLNDAVDLNYKAKKAKKALQLGSGLLGLELGNALTTLGLEVHVLELSDRILPYQTTPKSSLKLQGMLEKKGFVFHLKSEAMEAQGKERLERVLLKSGEVIDVDLMAVSTGITPNLSLATALELKIEKGIVVDQYMETTKPGIYAAGDCAQTP
ncbi:MAG: FAD-dependent oxidoreductase, partial [Deltaproteobacteria bacterium]|nr:FAD-dependent oxidoreductase [Deltaproteobacteria bacterium]